MALMESFVDGHPGKMTITHEDVEHPFALDREILAAGMHEAAHAVVGYALGFGCARIMIQPRWINDRVGIGGRADCSKTAIARVNAAIRRLRRGRGASADVALLHDYIVAVMAGFPAELKLRHETGAGAPNPNSMLNDVEVVNSIEIDLGCHRHHDAGRRTNAILNSAPVWNAVIAIGNLLAEELSRADSDQSVSYPQASK
jgi:hypothetical protein